MLARQADLKRRAFANLPLLQRVVDFKKRFYGGSAWTAYDAAKPGSFRLIPPDYSTDALARDYDAMAEMIYGERPHLETILAELRALEDEINALSWPAVPFLPNRRATLSCGCLLGVSPRLAGGYQPKLEHHRLVRPAR